MVLLSSVRRTYSIEVLLDCQGWNLTLHFHFVDFMDSFPQLWQLFTLQSFLDFIQMVAHPSCHMFGILKLFGGLLIRPWVTGVTIFDHAKC
jgi:hypothetical protein